jgi:anthranilate phosphoribosyltransferase
MIQQAIKTAIAKEDLSFELARQAMDEIMRGDATNAQIAAFLTALRMKGETIDEITACAAVMRERCTKLPHNKDVLEYRGDRRRTKRIPSTSRRQRVCGRLGGRRRRQER